MEGGAGRGGGTQPGFCTHCKMDLGSCGCKYGLGLKSRGCH